MANSKDIELAIKAKDLASKPLQDIGAAVDRLVSAVADIVPASEKGAKNITDLTATAGQLQKAMQGLKADAALVEQFTQLSASVAGASERLTVLRGETDAAKMALANSAAPTRAMTVAADSAASAANRQEVALGKLTARLETLKGKASAVGIDFTDLAGAQAKIDAAFASAAPAYARVNEAIELYSMRQREAKVAAEAAAVASAQDTAKLEAQTAAAAEANAMAERFTVSMRQEAGATAEAATRHGELSRSFSAVRTEGSRFVEFLRDQRREITALLAGYVGLMGAFEALKSGFESIEKLEGTKSILTQTFGAEGAGQQLDYVKAQADRLSLSYVDLARNYAKFSAAASGTGTSQSETRQVFETFAEAARVKNLSAEQQATIFQALDKIFAKDSVGATDLFRKLTTELPEAAAIFRKSIATLDDKPLTTDQFERLLKSGKITSEFVTKFAADYRASFAEQLPEATKSTTAALVTFGNAWDKFKVDILEGGALDAFKEALLKLTTFFKSDDGKKFASELSGAAKLIAQGFGLIVDHIGEIELALGVLASASAVNIGRSVYGDLMRLVGGFQTLASTINAAFETAPLLSKVLGGYAGVLASGFAGFKIGEWLNTNFASVRQFGVLFVGYFVTVFEAVKSVGKAAWAYIFDGASFKDAAAQVAKDVKAVNDSLKDQFNEAGKPVAPGEAAGASTPGAALGATPTVITAQQKADAAKAAQQALDEELFTAAKALQTKLSELRASLLKKDATDLAEYLRGVGEQFKPLYADIDKVKEEFPHNSQTLVNKLTAQLNSIKALTLTDATNKFNEDKAKSDLKDVSDLLRERNTLIQNEARRTAEGLQSPEQQRKNIAGINAEANPGIAASATQAQRFISTLPSEVQANLKQTTEELKTVLDGLTASTTLKDIKAQEEEINQQLQIRAQRISATEQLRQAGLLTATQEKEELAAIDKEYDPVIQKAKELITHIQTAKDLTADQQKALEGVVATLQTAVANAQKYEAALYPATKVADDIAQDAVGIAEAFAKAAGQGHNLGNSFRAAWQAFKSFASDFLLNIGKMIAQTTILNALGYGHGETSGGVPGGISSLVGGLFSGGGGSAIAATGAAAAGTDTGALASTIAASFHSGGYVGSGAGSNRHVLAAMFDNAARFHSGGSVGLSPGEVPAILQTGEQVLSRAQVKAGAGSQQAQQHIQVINGIDHEDIVRQGLAAPSNVKVILNMMRANRSSLKQALA